MRILLLDGNENQAVASVRSLAKAGHSVSVGADTSWSKAGWSRHAHATFTYPSPRRNARAFLDAIVEQATRQPGTFVLPLTESSMLPISAHRDELLGAGARLAMASHEAVLRAFDKTVTQRIAAGLGVATPRSCVVGSLAEAESAARELGYPVVLKARSSEQVGPGGAVRQAGAPRYARSPAGLARGFVELHAGSPSLLVQEFVQGRGAGYFALLHHGQLRAEFAHVRIRDVRPAGSGSAVRESVAVSNAVRDPSLAILRGLDWHGVAMVEYRLRPDGTPVFLEVNGRFWNSLALAIHAGVDFPALLATMAEQGDVAPVSGYRTGVRCRWLLGDLRHLVAVLAGPPPDFPGEFPGRLRTLAALARRTRGMHHDNFTWSDPLPELGDWLHFFLRRIPEVVATRARRAA